MKLGMAQGELESHSNPNNLVDRSPQHGEKECVVRVNPRVLFSFSAHVIHLNVFSHMTVFVVTR